MNRNVTINGKTYNNVDTVNLKISGSSSYAKFKETSDATATATDIKSGKTAYVNGNKITGTFVEEEPTLTTKEITTNGTFNASSEGADGFSSVTVNVPTEGTSVNNQDKTITENGTYTPDSGYTGFGSVVVNVPTGTTPTGTKEITENGTYDVSEFAQAIVNVATGGGSGSLPNGLVGVDFGTFKVDEDTTSDNPVIVNHNIGAIPDVVVYGITERDVSYSNLKVSNGVLYGIYQSGDKGTGTLLRITNDSGGATQQIAGQNIAAYGTYGGVLEATETQIKLGAMGSPAGYQNAGKTDASKYLKADYTYYWCAFKMSV